MPDVFVIQIVFATTRVVFNMGEYHSDIPPVLIGHIQSCDAFRPIVRERTY